MDELEMKEISISEEEMWISPEKNLPEAEELIALIEEKKISEFRALVENIPAPDMGAIMDDVPKEKRLIFYIYYLFFGSCLFFYDKFVYCV